MLTKHYLGISVLEAARRRIAWAFEVFPRIIVSLSGGKDSTVMCHLVMEEAMKRKRKVAVLFVDWEAQFSLTINHVKACFDLYADYIEPYWICLPFRTTNACSQFEPEWICWEPAKKSLWIRPMPSHAISDYNYFSFYDYAMTFEEFIECFAPWFAQGQLTASFVGIRTGESLNRWRTLAGHGVKWRDEDGRMRTWVNYKSQTSWNAYPIYDWCEEDIWTYHGKTGKIYNPLYDLMYKAGLTLHQMRVCEPYGDEQRKSLWLYKIIEPDTWARVVNRVAGANMAALYANKKGNIMGNGQITLPPGHTWRSYATMLLDSMPPPTAEHYRNKISIWLHWYCQNEGYTEDTLPQDLPDDMNKGKDVGSWRRVCKMLLSNDYWCYWLNFSETKTESYEKYRKLMQRRRQEWGFRF